MEIKETSAEFKEFFLLLFTKELIKSYMQQHFINLKIGEGAEKEAKYETIQERTKEAIKEYEQPLKLPPLKQLQGITTHEFKQLRVSPPRRLIIPKQELPPRLQYIHPVPTEKQINLFRLNPFIQDVFVQSIECNGPEEEIVVLTPDRRITNVKLSKEEIEEIIHTFSKEAKIPIKEGIFRVAVGRLVLSAIISDIVGIKFIIKKIRFPSLIPSGYNY